MATTFNVRGWLWGGNIYEFRDARVDSLSAVALSGSYNDLTDKPTVDSAVTETGSNAVTGAAVAAYVDAQLGVIADGSY